MLIVDHRKEGSFLFAAIDIYPFLMPESPRMETAMALNIRIHVSDKAHGTIYDDLRAQPIQMGMSRMSIDSAKQLRDALSKAIEIAESETNEQSPAR